ncbi:hypothetical protein F9855_07255 [Glaesserella parasuis]|nr:hypothetical protein [Glaesserella parasuis]MWP92211.1 hypothetical protein [Glaesserella parasuis]MWP94214.1 hypothetical protein [Glaesserella parasuis]MWP98034.1 hypothetical protein [Glaesserella parasuis]MWQ02296.1 hypothetical protein [Glaesserella parasuis]
MSISKSLRDEFITSATQHDIGAFFKGWTYNKVITISTIDIGTTYAISLSITISNNKTVIAVT